VKYVCVHGHFYQPPRENPSLEAIELQDSAYPYHDWNERVTAECYAPNAIARLLDDQQRIVQLVNNYAHISFNFGPTLLLWMEQKAPAVLAAIQQADKMSQEKFGGHGSAVAQVYNHMILPLAHPRDKETQVIWGIRDFEHRFGRKPEGMWLPETAADIASLEALAAQGIKFTILAPRQAKRVRRQGSRSWKDVSGDRIDPSRAYQVKLPSKKTIAVFFYDGPISQGVAFEGLLDDGKRFADRLMSGFSDARTWPQLSHIATDGESYGHHHHYGEMALSFALNDIETGGQAQLINYGQFLEMYPPDHQVEIIENTSWSCAHGVERWRSNCGCNSGGHGNWNQNWRAPLRESLDWLRDTLATKYEEQAKALLKDPWAARNAYIGVVLDRTDETINRFFAEHGAKELDQAEKVRALKLLEIQRNAMLMYTSCGWFFDELSGLETVQVIHYAGRAIQLAREVMNEDFEPQFCERLRNAKSNLSEPGDGEQIYKKWVAPAVVTMDKVVGHYAVSSLFETYGDKTKIFCYDVDRIENSLESEGKVRLAVGRVHVQSDITKEETILSYGVLHLGDHNITGGVRESQDENVFHELRDNLSAAFARADMTEVIRILDEQFDKTHFSLSSLFRDEQRRIVNLILKDTVNSVGASFKGVYENQAALMRFLSGLGVPVPPALSSAATIALNSQLQQALERPEIDASAVQSLVKEAAANRIALDDTTLEFTMRKRLEQQAAELAKKPDDLAELKRLHSMLDIAATLPRPALLWEVQNLCFAPLSRAANGNGHANGNGNGNGNGNANGSVATDDPEKQEYYREATVVREQLHIHGAS
jgi:alpha-amylase/alpha-mannosidase (GH57 family)